MLIVSDTSPISNLLLIDQIGLLHSIFPDIVVPPSVYKELMVSRKFDIARVFNSGQVEIKQVSNRPLLELLLTELDAGEAEAIVLAKELKAGVLLIDERKGRQKARSLGIPIMGVAGILLTAKDLGLIPEVKPMLDDLRQKAGFWMGNNFLPSQPALPSWLEAPAASTA